jgi:alkylhydroperoxidase family enzyme
VPQGLIAGLSQEQIDAIHEWKSSDLFNEKERAVLQYTDEETQDIRVSSEIFDAVKEFLTEEQVVELTIVIGFYSMISRFLETLQIELES